MHVLGTVLVVLRTSRGRYDLQTANKQEEVSPQNEFLKLWRALAPSMLYHGTFNFLLLSFSAVEGNVGWVHPTDAKGLAYALGGVAVVSGALVMHVRREWKRYERAEKKGQ